MSGPLNVQIRFSQTCEDIFRALIDSGSLEQWFCERAAVSLAKNRYDFWGRFTPGAPDQANGRHQILQLEENRFLRYSWIMDAGTEVRMAAVLCVGWCWDGSAQKYMARGSEAEPR